MNKEIEIPEGYEARIEGNKIFIELQESKDERIRKELIDHCIQGSKQRTIVSHKEDYKRWLAWLEKQKKQNLEDIEDEIVRKYMKLDKFALANMLAERDKTNAEIIESIESIEKQPAEWSEEDIDKMVNTRTRKSSTTKSEIEFYRQGIKDTLKLFNFI